MSSMTHRLGAGLIAASAALALAGPAQAKPVITLSGSTSVAPLAGKLARGYLKQYPGRVKFKLAQGGSDVGVADVGAGRVTIGMSSRDPKSSDPGGVFFNKIAKDGICIVTHPSNPVANLSQAQIQAIFSGRVREWGQVPGASVTGPIDINVRTAASGTQDAFQKIFLGSASVFSGAAQKASNGLIQQAVQSNKQAIGYVSLDFIDGVNAASYNGVACNLRNAKSGEYGGVRNFWLVTRGKPRGAVRRFIFWVQESGRAASIIQRGWVPLK